MGDGSARSPNPRGRRRRPGPRLLRECLDRRRLRGRSRGHRQRAYAMLAEREYALVIADWWLDDGNGLSIANEASSRGAKTFVSSGFELELLGENAERHRLDTKAGRPEPPACGGPRGHRRSRHQPDRDQAGDASLSAASIIAGWPSRDRRRRGYGRDGSISPATPGPPASCRPAGRRPAFPGQDSPGRPAAPSGRSITWPPAHCRAGTRNTTPSLRGAQRRSNLAADVLRLAREIASLRSQ